jgi:hypothetical protein
MLTRGWAELPQTVDNKEGNGLYLMENTFVHC